MPRDHVKHAIPHVRLPLVSALLVIAASIFVAVALYAPRAVAPGRLPILQLDQEATRAAIAHDEALARQLPSGRWVDELRALCAELGRTHYGPPVSAAHLRSRYLRGQRLGRAVRERHGEAGLAALRAAAVAQLADALANRLSRTRTQELLGGFEKQLVRYHVLDPRGGQRAPTLVLRSMFKARWNALWNLEPTSGFSPIEVQAYEGWLALHGEGAPQELRHAAAVRFRSAGGHRGAEAVAVWAARLGHQEEAQHALALAMEQGRNVRLRNYAIGLRDR